MLRSGRILSFVMVLVAVGCSGTTSNRSGFVPQTNDLRLRRALPTPSASPSAEPSPSYSILHQFGGHGDGRAPWGDLIVAGGTLYGTTRQGGAHNVGTVYSCTTTGAEKVTYSFLGHRDGAYPESGLTLLGATLYGTTYSGGAANAGTVYALTYAGAKTIVHSFGQGSDGRNPRGALVAVNGVLYGTTEYGGAVGMGTLVGVNPTGSELVVHSFGSGHDGQYPLAGLLTVGGALYGTAVYGGQWGTGNSGGAVFAIDSSGAEAVLHSFGHGNDGDDPLSDLTDVNGTLYGTTAYGGKYGQGTVFSITASGSEQVLYSFGATIGDGENPVAGLTLFNGALYGTTYAGGANGVGTVFSITTDGHETVLHSFARSRTDGNSPAGGLTAVGNVLIGTTNAGGQHKAGVVYELTP